jgi:uncharacterized caspase-like protein
MICRAEIAALAVGAALAAVCGCGGQRQTQGVAKAKPTDAFPELWGQQPTATAMAAASQSEGEVAAGRALTLDARKLSGSNVYSASHAVVIGIDSYQHVRPLTGAVRDAKSVAAVLTKRGFAVTTLLDRQSTRAAISELLADQLPNKLGEQDRVLVYFAGHGVSTGQGDHRMGYLVPIEGDRDRLRSTGISMSELQQWLAGYPAKHVLFAADACYSGLALSTRSLGISAVTSGYLRDITSRNVRFTLVAGRDDQVAYEHGNQGVFTRFFIEGLEGRADHNHDGLITTDELASFVKPQVSTFVAQNFKGSQTPQAARTGLGEFVFFQREE